MFERIQKFFADELWLLADRLEGWPKRGIRVLQILFVTGKDYVEDKCSIRAAALTFYSALSLVPILALLFGIAKGFGFEEMLKEQIISSNDQNKEVFLHMFSFAENTLVNAKGGLVAGIGIILLLYTVLKTFALIENAFNEIWEVKQGRTWLRKFTDYLSIALLAPFLLIFSGSVTVFIATNVQEVAAQLGIISWVGPVVNFGLNFTSYFLIWILFLAIYMIMPNKQVKFSSAIIAAVVAGSAYQVTEWVYISFQVGVSRYNGIYGSFAAVPLFLLWVQISWTIVLFGAELSYAIQNINEVIRTYKKKTATPYQKLKHAILVMQNLVNHYPDKEPFRTAEAISSELDLGFDRVVNILYDLERINLVVSVERGDELVYQPSRDSKELNVVFIIEAMLGENSSDLPQEHQQIEDLIEQLRTDLNQSKANVYLRN
jgi:membrane protein